jgi:hypothetical protein
VKDLERAAAIEDRGQDPGVDEVAFGGDDGSVLCGVSHGLRRTGHCRVSQNHGEGERTECPFRFVQRIRTVIRSHAITQHNVTPGTRPSAISPRELDGATPACEDGPEEINEKAHRGCFLAVVSSLTCLPPGAIIGGADHSLVTDMASTYVDERPVDASVRSCRV